MKRNLILIATCMILASSPVGAAVDPADARLESERMEDLHLLHRHAIQNLHDAKALALYLVGWQGPDRRNAVEELFREAEDIYGILRGAGSGAAALQAEVDVLGADSPSAAQLGLLQRMRGEAARRVNDYHDRCKTLKAQLAEDVAEAARRKIQWEVVSEPEPWEDPAREAGRKDGLPFGYTLRDDFFELPRAEGDYALRKARKAGLSYCQISRAAACNWGDIETEPNRYDFSALDAMVARLGRHGLRACLMLSSLGGSPPAWHIERFGADCRFAVPGTGGDAGKKTQAGINIFHGPTGEAYDKFLAAYAAHLKEKYPASVDAVYVDGVWHEIGAPVDESGAMDVFWRAWCARQPGMESSRAGPWRTPEAIRAAEPVDEAAFAAAEACREAWVLEYIRRVTDGLKKGWPDVRVQIMTVNHDMHRIGRHPAEKSRDLYRLAELGATPNTGATSHSSLDLLRSFAGGRWLWHYFMPIGCGAKTSACNAQAPFFDVSRISYNSGLGGFDRHNFPAGWYRYSDWQLGDFGIGSYFLTPRRAQELAPVILNTSVAPADVAVLWSQTSLRRDATYELHKEAIGWGHLLRRAFVPFDFVPQYGLADRLASYKALILPNTQSMTPQTCEVIRRWVNGGGVLLGFGAPGIFDDKGNRRPTIPLADVFGADVASMRTPAPLEPDKLYTGHPEGPFISPPPSAYMYNSNLTAALAPAAGTARAWFAGVEKHVAIVENTFGAGKAMLCGYPLGFLYWETAPYELIFGPTHHRQTTYNHEQNQYEKWIAREMGRLGIGRPVVVERGTFLRAQKADDPEWTHTFRLSPKYSEYMFEKDEPARSILAFLRKRDGIDNLYVGLVNSEMNYFLERGYFISILTGGQVTTAVALPAPAEGSPLQAVVFDARLGVPVPSRREGGRIVFDTWVPLAQPAAFAVAPGGEVRLFGPGKPSGDGPEVVAERTRLYAGTETPAQIEILDADRIAAFLEERRGKSTVIACGDTRYRPAAESLAQWLKRSYEIDSRITTVGSRISCRWAYQDGFGYVSNGHEETAAEMLIGNCQDNGLMWRYTWMWGVDTRYWLPLEANSMFPGAGRAIVMLSSPVATDGSGRATGKEVPRQLVVGASFPSEALAAVRALQER